MEIWLLVFVASLTVNEIEHKNLNNYSSFNLYRKLVEPVCSEFWHFFSFRISQFFAKMVILLRPVNLEAVESFWQLTKNIVRSTLNISGVHPIMKYIRDYGTLINSFRFSIGKVSNIINLKLYNIASFRRS